MRSVNPLEREQESLERDLSIASKALSNSPGRLAQGAENKYGQAYQALVRAGYRPQLRYKYRVPKG
jgi:hypothetical protein